MIEEIDKILSWYRQRGGLLPYDWDDNFTPKWIEFKESQCNHVFEAYQKSKVECKIKCMKCGKEWERVMIRNKL